VIRAASWVHQQSEELTIEDSSIRRRNQGVEWMWKDAGGVMREAPRPLLSRGGATPLACGFAVLLQHADFAGVLAGKT
jgi:hypothetical protein